MKTYRVWDPVDSDESAAREIDAASRAEAAQDFAERHDRDDWIDGDRRTYHVRDAGGRLWAVDLTCTLEPVYRTGEPAPVDEQHDATHHTVLRQMLAELKERLELKLYINEDDTRARIAALESALMEQR